MRIKDKTEALKNIKIELKERLKELEKEHKLIESHRLKQRTLYDLDMMEEMGYSAPDKTYKTHTIMGKTFDPDSAEEYTRSFAIGRV